jgi:hypothetical protein
VNEHKKKEWKSHKKAPSTGRVLNDLLKEYFVGMLTLVVRRSALESLDYYCDPRYHIIGDFDLVIRLAIHWKLDCLHEPVAYYRQHEGSESYKHRSRQANEMECWLREKNEIENISSCSNWHMIKNSFTYHSAINQVLLGNKKAAYGLSKRLPWGKSKIKLLFSLLLPTSYIQQRLQH